MGSGSAAHAQTVRRIVLGQTFESLEHEFERISGVRDIGNGRAIVLDSRSRTPLLLVDFVRRTASQVGRHGDGPGEYRNPGSLTPIGRDSTLLSDWHHRRWLVLSGGEIVGLIPRDQEPAVAVGPVLAGGDVAGRVLGVIGFGFTGPVPLHGPAQADSGLVVLGDLHRQRADTVARIRGGSARLHNIRLVRPEVDINPGQLSVNPLLVPDQALLFPDGWIAVARQGPFRVDWRDPSGRWHRGPALPEEAGPLTEADRRQALTHLYPTLNTSQTPTSVFPDWPRSLPPFLNDALLALPSGHLLIRRTRPAGAGSVRYDVVDRRGALVATLELPTAQKIVGAGLHGLYVSVSDDVGLQELRRYLLPGLR